MSPPSTKTADRRVEMPGRIQSNRSGYTSLKSASDFKLRSNRSGNGKLEVYI
ncbi:hypothetical protein PLEOSDRAFT_1105825 [Pleurotus ostreatus PC15]|uniref:Uncharacterized protein n=1 Tax=Pleurotus ostreatus (strain PC15) TaxID=1137138 RepID=A0A067NGG2_PLEO1|nr:hypothetical protein PLEOSDRAFT_1105825 [Pleurotus ostreatus PC15]